MKDITVSEVKKMAQGAKEAQEFGEERFPYLEAYGELNQAIIEKAKVGGNSISFDFVDEQMKNETPFLDVKKEHNRIYLSTEGGQAEYNVYDYPSYLIARGFNVEIRKSQRSHGYKAKSYFISW